MSIVNDIKLQVVASLKELYSLDLGVSDLTVNSTKPEFEGDYTLVLFSFVKQLKKSPDQLGKEIGEALLKSRPDLFSAFNAIKGFLNLTIGDSYWTNFLGANYTNKNIGRKPANGQRIVVEYSSPNTNKPLHLGHLRNNFLGWSIAEILKANGYEVYKTCIYNDRGIHICKSMVAWQLFANGATPESTGIKGDHLVGDYYVQFGNELKKQSKPILESIFSGNDLSIFSESEKTKINTELLKLGELHSKLEETFKKTDFSPLAKLGAEANSLFEAASKGEIKWKDILKRFDNENAGEQELKAKEQVLKEIQKVLKPVVLLEEKMAEVKSEIQDIAENKTSIMQQAQQMLIDWEAGKPEVIELWKKMNSWVYAGFNVTYNRVGSDFDKVYYESETYLLGKKAVEEGLSKKVFYRKEDGSVWIDLTADGLDEKVVQRRDGTAVYITQDIGLAEEKQKEFNSQQSIYVVADEQNYHFKVLKLICEKLGVPGADGIYHLSYGLVELPTGRMKTREGTVVDADDLLDEMNKESEKKTNEQIEQGKIKKDNFAEGELKELYEMIGTGGIKFFLLRVDPKKRMIFNPEESIELNGFTATFIQYAHARIKSILREERAVNPLAPAISPLFPLEKQLIVLLEQYPAILGQAADEHNPSLLAIYAFNLAQLFNSFYHEHKVLKAESAEKKQLRLQLSELIGHTISSAMGMLGIGVPERM